MHFSVLECLQESCQTQQLCVDGAVIVDSASIRLVALSARRDLQSPLPFRLALCGAGDSNGVLAR